MNTEEVFNAIFWTLLVLMFLMRFWFGFRVWRTGERILAEPRCTSTRGLVGACRRIRVLSSARRARSAFSGFKAAVSEDFAFPAPGWLRWAGFGLGIIERGTICVDAYGPGTFLVPLLATSPWPPVDCRRSLRTNPAPDVFRDSGVDDQSWSGGGQLDSFCIRDARRAEFHVADSRGRKNDVTTVR